MQRAASHRGGLARFAALVGIVALGVACGGSEPDERSQETENDSAPNDSAPNDSAPNDSALNDKVPVTIPPNATWQWQLQGEINTSYDVDVYDIDLFDVAESVIDELHGEGRVVICYYSAGSYEQWRPDVGDYPDAALGESLDGWEGERWVDIRSESVRSVIARRHGLAVRKGCDGVEPDNVTAFQNATGFDLDASDQLDFNRFLADDAHQRGLLIGLKNDTSQIPELIVSFDFAVNEECHEFGECDAYAPFVDAGKSVFNAEYSSDAISEPDVVCNAAARLGVHTLILPLDLDDEFRIDCRA